VSEAWAVVVHGGCKPVSRDEEAPNRVGIEQAVTAAAEVLRGGGSALDAVEAAVRSMENNPTFNAGTGSVSNADGVVEMDASIMDGEQLQIGAVCALQKVRNPVSVARAMLQIEETLLTADGAQRFALENGFRLEEVAGREDHAAGCDTVGCVALDQRGQVAAATSTGGLQGSRVGRIGDSPLPGCGFYADSSVGGVSATGEGERIARVTLAARIMHLLESGEDPQRAAELGLAALERVGGDAGVIVLHRDGRIGWSFNATQIAVGWMTSSDTAAHALVAGMDDAPAEGRSRLN
jgi:beta-aspartyl-peptidase (threonine type)